MKKTISTYQYLIGKKICTSYKCMGTVIERWMVVLGEKNDNYFKCRCDNGSICDEKKKVVEKIYLNTLINKA